MNDYTPVPEADLEAAIMETLTLLRQNSTEGRTALDALHTLAQHLEWERSVREAQYKNVEILLREVNSTIMEANNIIKNSKPAQKSHIETAIDILKIVSMSSFILFLVVMSILAGTDVVTYFRPR